ncbi:hypothetical protein GGX14DRAFT_561510 [Mycena pura]|uniref:Uncharacterized protein n=1 Tax=Mycena pura TaxID=153505 RepID=A0AAD6YIR7_9AGAR|nr:hypothetical protein GGX14DRAFT_561510 [Mycena pura]
MELLSVTSRDVPTAWLEEEKELTTLLKDPPSPEETVNGRRYRQSLNALHALVVLRLLELEKVKMAGTGYKMRKRIAKALQARSKSLKNAITQYNEAAPALGWPLLTWQEVV